MLAVYVPPERIPCPRGAVIAAMRAALIGSTTDPRCVALAVAKSALETGRWLKMYNYNFGNVKAGPKYEGQYTAFRCNEVLGGKIRWFSPEGETDRAGTLLPGAERYAVPPCHPQTRFRAYAGLTDGVYSYVDVLIARFPRSFQALLTGNAKTFVETLKAERYFTADVGPYIDGVSSMQREFVRVMEGDSNVPESAVDPELERMLSVADMLLVEDSRDVVGPAGPNFAATDDLPDTEPAT